MKVTHLFMQHKHLKHIFFWPLVLGLITFLGLIFALLEDGGFIEQVSLLALVVPIGSIFYYYWFK